MEEQSVASVCLLDPSLRTLGGVVTVSSSARHAVNAPVDDKHVGYFVFFSPFVAGLFRGPTLTVQPVGSISRASSSPYCSEFIAVFTFFHSVQFTCLVVLTGDVLRSLAGHCQCIPLFIR